ncbi:MAG: hypothetical protein KC486_36200, partial [Myxococcales bacterium]|nr:hypothetical protein [Myxococcales bacterium]
GAELRIAAAADGIAVGVGLTPAGAEGRGGLFVVHKEGFEVARERLDLGLVISATDDRATIDRFSLELLPSPRTDALLDRVGEAVDRLVTAAIDAVTARDGEEASVEVRSRGAALLLDLLRAVYRVPARIQEHIRLLRRGVPHGQVAALLGDRCVSDGALRLPHYRRYRQGIIERIDARMGRRLGELIAVPLFPTIAGATLSLAALVAKAARRGGTFRYALAPPGCVRDPVAAEIIAARSDEVERLLEPLFGAEALREVSLASLRAEARREAKTRRRTLPPAPTPRPRGAPRSPELRAVIETIERVEVVDLVADTAGAEVSASFVSVDEVEVISRGDGSGERDLLASASVEDVEDVEQLEAIELFAEVELEIDGEGRIVDDADVEVLSLLEVEEVDDEAELIDGLHAWLEASEPAPAPTKPAPTSPPPVVAARVAEATADAPVDDALCSAALPGGVGRIWLAASVVEHLELRGGGIVEGASLPGILELSGEGAIDEGDLLAAHVGLHRALVVAVRGGEGEPAAIDRRARAYLLEVALRHRGRPLPELAELGLDRLVAELEEAPLVAGEGGWISVAEAIRERVPEVLARLDEIAPPAPNRTPAARLFDALCAEVRAVRAADDALILETWLAGLVLADGGRRGAAVVAAGGRLQLYRGHPLVTAALASASASDGP